MSVFSWISKSLSRQVSMLLVVIISAALLLPAFYFYQLQSEKLRYTTEQMARQLAESLNIAIAKQVHIGDRYSVWLTIKEELKNNKRQIEHGGLLKIQEVAVLDDNANTFSHNSPRNHPLQKKYTGFLPDKIKPFSNIRETLITWIQDETKAVRLYSNIEFQGRHVGVLIVQLDLTLLYAQQDKLIADFISYFVAILILAIFIGFKFGYWVSHPLHVLENSLESMGSGKLNVPELHQRMDEYNSLATAIENVDRDLYKSQTQIHLLLDSTAEAICGVDVNGNCTFVNHACLKILGYTKNSELLGKNIHELIHHSYANGTPYSVEDSLIYRAFHKSFDVHADDEVFWRKDGSSFLVEYWAHPIINDGECVGAVVAFFDITERIKAREKLQEREQYLSLMLHSIGDAVIATDAKGLVRRMNPIAEQLTGWSFNNAQGKPVSDVFSIINATTREPIKNPVEKVLSTGEIVHLSNHTTLISKSGKECQISDSAAPILDKDNEVQGMVLVFNDISEQYHLRELASKSKRDLQRIMDYTPAVIYAKDTDGRYIFINHKFEELFDVESKNIVGQSDHELFPAIFADEFVKHDQSVLAAGRAIEFEELVKHDDGLHNYISTKFPLFNDRGEAYAVCGISTDITERKKQEEQLRRSQKMDALGKLTGGVAHDYNNLLGIIAGYAELLHEQLSEHPKLIKYVDDISYAARRGEKLTKKLLVFSKYTDTEKQLINISTLLTEQRLMLEKSLTARVTISLDLDEYLWSTYLDADDLEDAIINICINAMHAMEDGGELTIQTRNLQLAGKDAGALNLLAGDYIFVSVVDTGSGMDDETRDKMFDPFFTTKGDGGTGLGLSQVYGFVKRSNGAIKVYSELGHGTCISFYFPRSLISTVKIPEPAVSTIATLRGTETILVVDDEKAMVELAQDIFEQQGYHVLTSSDGEDALIILKNEQVDLLLSDVIMPNMDGYQLAATVQQLYPHIKIQMVSGFSDNRHHGMVSESLSENILYKPYTSKILLEHVRILLNKKIMNDDKEITSITKCTVLVVDDEPDVRELFMMNLKRLGCNTLLAANADEAIAYYQQSLNGEKAIDAVILDLNLAGGLGGKDIAKKIHDLNADAKIIVASGNTEAVEMRDYHEHGFCAALEKNFDRKKIKQALEKILFTAG